MDLDDPTDRSMITLLRLEGLVGLVAGVSVYAALGGGWILFLLLILAPDLAMLGYLAGDRAGAAAYNTVHTYVAPALLAAVAWWLGDPLPGRIAAVWVSHIGMDRALGFGLKRAAGFRHTHLGILPGGGEG